MRGRLLFPLLARIGRLDPVATDADPDGAGPLQSGYDDEFRETMIVAQADTSERGAGTRRETMVDLLAQVEPADTERLSEAATGASPTSALTLVLHYAELEEKGLVAADGAPLLRIGDRLAELRDPVSGALVETFRDPPGLFAVAVTPGGGWLGQRRNLLLMIFADRQLSVRG
jgi:hypothetical protein